MNGKFAEKYGASWAELNSDMKMMAIMSEIFDLRENVFENRKIVTHNFNQFLVRCDDIEKNRDALNRHATYWKLAIAMGSIVVATVLGYIVPKLLGLF